MLLAQRSGDKVSQTRSGKEEGVEEGGVEEGGWREEEGGGRERKGQRLREVPEARRQGLWIRGGTVALGDRRFAPSPLHGA